VFLILNSFILLVYGMELLDCILNFPGLIFFRLYSPLVTSFSSCQDDYRLLIFEVEVEEVGPSFRHCVVYVFRHFFKPFVGVICRCWFFQAAIVSLWLFSMRVRVLVRVNSVSVLLSFYLPTTFHWSSSLFNGYWMGYCVSC